MSYRPRPSGKSGAGLACLSAGPVFLVSVLMAIAMQQPDAILPSIGFFAMVLTAGMPIALLIGTALGFLPVLIGIAMMVALGRRYAAARGPVAWSLAGAVMGGLIGALFGAPWWIEVAMITTGLVCARIAHRGADWSEACGGAICAA